MAQTRMHHGPRVCRFEQNEVAVSVAIVREAVERSAVWITMTIGAYFGSGRVNWAGGMCAQFREFEGGILLSWKRVT